MTLAADSWHTAPDYPSDTLAHLFSRHRLRVNRRKGRLWGLMYSVAAAVAVVGDYWGTS